MDSQLAELMRRRRDKADGVTTTDASTPRRSRRRSNTGGESEQQQEDSKPRSARKTTHRRKSNNLETEDGSAPAVKSSSKGSRRKSLTHTPSASSGVTASSSRSSKSRSSANQQLSNSDHRPRRSKNTDDSLTKSPMRRRPTSKSSLEISSDDAESLDSDQLSSEAETKASHQSRGSKNHASPPRRSQKSFSSEDSSLSLPKSPIRPKTSSRPKSPIRPKSPVQRKVSSDSKDEVAPDFKKKSMVEELVAPAAADGFGSGDVEFGADFGGGGAAFGADFGSTATSGFEVDNAPAFGAAGFRDSNDAAATAFATDVAADAAFCTASGFESTDNLQFGAFDATSAPDFSTADAGAFDGAFAADDGTDMFASAFPVEGGDGYEPPKFELEPPKPVYDTTPIEDPPTMGDGPTPPLLLQPRQILSQVCYPEPVVHPLSGHYIVCKQQQVSSVHGNPRAPKKTPVEGNTTWSLCELDPYRGYATVAQVPILTVELQRRIATRYGVSVRAVDAVLTVGVGSSIVAALVDLLVIENNEVLRVLCLWQWKSKSNDGNIELLVVQSPPSGGDYSYNTSSLHVADDCVLISGASTKGPCIFVTQPKVPEKWSANFIVSSSGARIAHIAVSPTMFQLAPNTLPTPYVAISLTNGSVSIWVMATKKSSDRRLMSPLCKLNVSDEVWTNVPIVGTDAESDETQVGYCTNLSWVDPRPAYDSLVLLAAAFQGGVALYHVAMPVNYDKSKGTISPFAPPSTSTTLNQSVVISPICAMCTPTTYRDGMATWFDLGPHNDPCIAVLWNKHDGTCARVVVLSCPIAAYDPKPVKAKSSSDIAAFRLLCTTEWLSEEDMPSPMPRGWLSCPSVPGLVYFTDTGIWKLPMNGLRVHVGHAICSTPAGLTSSGSVRDDEASMDGTVLHVYTVWHCERKRRSGENSSILDWSAPNRRNWLIRTFIGDSKDAGAKQIPSSKDEEVILGGSHSEIVCELTQETSIPQRIVRGERTTAVLQGDINGPNLISHSIIMVESAPTSNKRGEILQVVDGCDVAFLPSGSSDTERALILDSSGGSIALWQLWHLDEKEDESKTEEEKEKPSKRIWMSSSSHRPVLGVEADDRFVKCLRVSVVNFESKISLLMVVHQKENGKHGILAGPLMDVSKSDWGGEYDWSELLPVMSDSPSFWLPLGEEVRTISTLPPEQSIRGGIAVATNKRVLILSADMTLMAETFTSTPPYSIAAVGSHTVGFCSSDHKIRYLSGLEYPYANGLVATLPSSRYNYCPHLLLAVRPDRLLSTPWHSGVRLVERGEPTNAFLLPSAVTRPGLLLEPMLANAVASAGKDPSDAPFLQAILEKFGRKVATMTHGEGEGLGNHGAGITPRVFEILAHYQLKDAASWLLTGTVNFDRSANSRLLPTWMPMSARANGALDDDTKLHLIANGDQFFSDYIKSPDQNMSSTLPRTSDPSAIYSNEFAKKALAEGRSLDAIKMFDVVGTEKSESILLQISLVLQLNPGTDVSKILKCLCQTDAQAGKSSNTTAAASLAALSLELRSKRILDGKSANEDFSKRWMRRLAPSLQRGKRTGRLRQRIIGELALAKIRGSQANASKSKLFITEPVEAKHVWNEGPKREKDNLLMLDSIEEWFGRRRPVILGREGAKSAEDRGASTLADILNQTDEDSFGAENEDDFKDGWVEGVGEGQKDEDKLCGYFRFSEGADDEPAWQEEGFADLTKFENKSFIVGAKDKMALEESKSSVDKGESGKVKALYDLVFQSSGVGKSNAFAIPATRGGSLDVGIMHGPDHESRQKCSIEFWFWVPESIRTECVLIRRTFGSAANDFEKVCQAKDSSSMLWELVLLPEGELEIRTVAGESSKSKPPPSDDDDQKGDDDSAPKNSIVWSRWNHICLTFSQEAITSSMVSLYIKGSKLLSKSLSFTPPNFVIDEFAGASALDEMLEKSHLLFGLNHPAKFRTTEIRIWALERTDDDIRTMMREYLDCAEIKRKFRVKIKKKSLGGKLPMPGGLASPDAVAAPRGGLAPPVGLKPIGDALRSNRKGGLLAPPKHPRDGEAKSASVPSTTDAFGFGPSADPAAAVDIAKTANAFGSDMFGTFGKNEISEPESSEPPSDAFGSGFGDQNIPSAFEATDAFGDTADTGNPVSDEGEEQTELPSIESHEEEERVDEVHEMPEISPLWDSAIPLSEQVRSSAAAALIRGPPATRHFGGNRGGLPDYRELERFGVGAISICGSEKTIVWRDDQVPPGLTYPIGASGAIVSDQMDEEGSEFLCCFLAKDKRMVVFELSTRTVVVELQMTTKLNYWRFLPPEAGEDTLCFMLITPVGGFHWMPLDESPRPRQVWKRGPELQGKKIVCYEEGGTNGMDGPDMLSKVGMLLATNTSSDGSLEAWLVPVCGDSQAICASDDVLGACLCCPPDVGYEAWMPLLLFVMESGESSDLIVCVSAVTELSEGVVGLTDVITDALIEMSPYNHPDMEFAPPTLAMGTWPEVICCSLGSTIVTIVRRKGLVVAYELADTGLELIAQENVGRFVIDAVMRYSALEGGAEIVLLMADEENPRDGRVGTFCFRAAL